MIYLSHFGWGLFLILPHKPTMVETWLCSCDYARLRGMALGPKLVRHICVCRTITGMYVYVTQPNLRAFSHVLFSQKPLG